jgi:hypothetical protein
MPPLSLGDNQSTENTAVPRWNSGVSVEQDRALAVARPVALLPHTAGLDDPNRPVEAVERDQLEEKPGGGRGRPRATGRADYIGQIFQITPVPGIWSSGPLAGGPIALPKESRFP